MKSLLFLLSLVFLAAACNSDKRPVRSVSDYKRVSQDFNADSAYLYTERQTAFGPRVPNTEPHVACKNYLVEKLSQFGAEVSVQPAKVVKFNGDTLSIFNIIASVNPNADTAILLMAHWDTRFMADMCSIDSLKSKPIAGANDGAGSTAILLEIIRQMQLVPPTIRVDVVLFDAEDQGEPNSHRLETWCLGSDYWSKNPHKPNYKADLGILLDMVSGHNAFFTRESNSMHFAPNVMNEIWYLAERLGYNESFSFQETHFVGIDDHVPVNINLKIPSAAIIQYSEERKSFAEYWHTHNDHMDAVSKESLAKVGQVLLELIYTYKRGAGTETETHRIN